MEINSFSKKLIELMQWLERVYKEIFCEGFCLRVLYA